MMRMLLIAFLVEIGLVLIVLPWSAYWDHNYFVSALPSVRAFLINNYVRGAVSGLGVLNMTVAIADLLSPLFLRRPAGPRSVGITPSSAAAEE